MSPEARGSAVVLTLVTPGGTPGVDLPALARDAARAGVDRIQVREKHLSGRSLRDLVAAIVRAVEGTPTDVFVNSRPDVAAVAGACGVQLPGDGLPVGDVKRGFPGLCVGASCHTLEAAIRAESEGADFVVLGPVFRTPGKPRALGLERLAEAAAALRIPVHAVGGIDPETGPGAVAAGAAGLLAIRAFLSGSVEAAARGLRGVP